MFRVLAFFLSTAAWAASCNTAAPECTEWLKLGTSDSRSMLYRSHSLDVRNPRITRALVVIHGQGRNADDYFRTGMAAAFLADALEDTVVISPRFASNDGRGCKDNLASGEVNWRCSGDSWRSGAVALTDPNLTSYDFVDTILRKLAKREAFPNLKSIVVSGHSAGGQYVSRYVAATMIHESLGLPVTYVVSNPSSYAYLDDKRPGPTNNCPAYDRWPYGMQNRTGYSAKLSDEQFRKQIASRPVIYLLSEQDTLPLAGFDSSCSAMAQGPNRFERGKAYAAYVNEQFGAKHVVKPVPLCGHNARCVFTADAALPVLFPR